MTSLQPGSAVSVAAGRPDRSANAMLFGLAALAVALFPASLRAAPVPVSCSTEGTIVNPTVANAIRDYVSDSLTKFGVPGAAITIVNSPYTYYVVCGDRSDGKPIDSNTVFQIGSLTKGFLATTMALMVQRDKMKWSDTVVTHQWDFQLWDGSISKEFEMSDLLAQRSGLPDYANDMVGTLGASNVAMINSLRYVVPDRRAWKDNSYTNIPQMEAARIVARMDGFPESNLDWNLVLQKEVFAKLDMPNSSYTAAKIEAAANHADGHHWTPKATIWVPFSPIFPYGFGAAGDINSSAHDLEQWLRLQINDGKIPHKEGYLVESKFLAKTREPQVVIDPVKNPNDFYGLGWMASKMSGRKLIWHSGSTLSFGAFMGWWPDKKIGVVVLTNAADKGLPNALGAWILMKLDDPHADPADYVDAAFKSATEKYLKQEEGFRRPKDPLPTPLDGLDGEFANSSFGKASLWRKNDTLILKLATGAELELKPWSGDKLTKSLVATGDFEALAKNLGALPLGFATLVSGAAGAKRDLLLEFDNGQGYQFQRLTTASRQ